MASPDDTPMLAGHFAAGLLGRRLAPRISLGTFVLAALLADLLWCLFLLAGIERIAVEHGTTTQDSLRAINIAFSHSLLMDFLWAALFAGSFFWRRRSAGGAVVLFAAVLS